MSPAKCSVASAGNNPSDNVTEIAIWEQFDCSIITTKTKNKVLYDSLVISVVTYSAASWTLTKAQQLRLDAFNTKALRRILGIRWHDRVTNTDVYARTGQHPLTTTIRKRRLGAFGHICRLPPGTQGIDILSSSAPASWRRPRGRPPLRWTDQICEDIQLSHDDAVAATSDRTDWRTLIRDATHTTLLAT